VLFGCAFQMFQILLEGILVELRQKLWLGGEIQFANVVDQLTFAHGVLTFKMKSDQDYYKRESSAAIRLRLIGRLSPST